MLTKTQITVNLDLIKQASEINVDNFRTPINQPTGDFFYDPWQIKEEFKNTVWDNLLTSISQHYSIGEARIINLQSGMCYQIHADIDDRIHLNICGENSYLIDLTSNTMFLLTHDSYWYEMDASKLHSAVNFGRIPRIQLVVRKLLNKSLIQNPVYITIKSTLKSKDHSRFIFDQTISTWLNVANKKKIINNFSFNKDNTVSFNIEQEYINQLSQVVPNTFKIII